MNYLVFDIGGTNFRSAVYDSETGKLIGEPKVVPTPSLIRTPGVAPKDLQTQLITALVATVREYQDSGITVNAVGLSVPGPVTSIGTIRYAPSLWGTDEKDYPLGDTLRAALPGLQFVVANDLSAATSYYASLPAHRTAEKDYAEVLTISTGVGGKVFSRKSGKIKLDSTGIGGEPGHVPVNTGSDALECGCGASGDLNAESSGTGVARRARAWAQHKLSRFKSSQLPGLLAKELGEDLTHYTSAQLATKFSGQSDAIVNKLIIQALRTQDADGNPKARDEFARELLDYTTQFVVKHMEHVVASAGVTRFIFIGGFAKALGEEYRQSVFRSLEESHFFRTNFDLAKDAVKDSLIMMGSSEPYEGLLGMGIMAAKSFPTPIVSAGATASASATVSPFLETGKYARRADVASGYAY